jgi:hypothetical protein
MQDSNDPKWKQFERVVDRVYRLLSPGCDVKLDDRIMGMTSESLRQIDISIRTEVAGSKILIIVQCKDEKSPLDVNKIGEFKAVMEDVRASRGILICNAGFSKAARTSAARSGIDLCRIHDAETKDWRLELRVPVIWEEILPEIQVRFNCALNMGDTLNEASMTRISDLDLREMLREKWLHGAVPLDSDEGVVDHGISSPFTRLEGGDTRPIEAFVFQYKLHRTFFLAYLDELPRSKAIQNIISNETTFAVSIEDLAQYRDRGYPKFRTMKEIPVHAENHMRVLMQPRFDLDHRRKYFSVEKIS